MHISRIRIWHIISRTHQISTRSFHIEARSHRSHSIKNSLLEPGRSSSISNLTVKLRSFIIGSSLLYFLYQVDQVQNTSIAQPKNSEHNQQDEDLSVLESSAEIPGICSAPPSQARKLIPAELSTWGISATRLSFFSTDNSNIDSVKSTIVEYVLPAWAISLPAHLSKLQKELSMAPGSLADELWKAAQDPYLHPEINKDARVRVSSDLCEEEKNYLKRRKIFTKNALASYLQIPQEEVHVDDVPTIAIVSSGGGLRALVSGTGSLLATKRDGLFDCTAYTAGVSGSCWLQALFNSSLTNQSFENVIRHLKARIGVHIAYPLDALTTLNTAPTNRYLLSGIIEKLYGDPNSNIGLVDVYGLLLGARLLVPKGNLAVNDADLKISSQRKFIDHGHYPMPIYTAVRHHIPASKDSSIMEKFTNNFSERVSSKADKEAWFQWFEVSPYEVFCEEFGAGIPTWSIGRKFEGGINVPHDESGIQLPELRLTLLLGIFGSAFCATLSHYYKEIRPLVSGLTGFGSLDEMIVDKNEHMSKVHPINPSSIPNYTYKMNDVLPETVPEEVYQARYIQLMDAGMSNNLPIYPLLRPGRDVDVLIAFDASADVKTENWLSVAEGYARQRGIKGWPVGAGWPKPSDSSETAIRKLEKAEASTAVEAEVKLEAAKNEDEKLAKRHQPRGEQELTNNHDSNSELGHCTIWVGRMEERSSSADMVKSKAVEEDWELMEPNSGITIIYFPFLSNPRIEKVDPATSEYMSTWNFVYTSSEIDNVVALAQANFDEGKERTRRCIRAVYERKKKQREERETAQKNLRRRRKVRLGTVGKKGEGDHFYLT
ncbi:Phospholipase [Blumeria graminis f. sp. tritici 96224]|nr:Phospholipase [Blumeria graminis f. sp. tritici 96224]